MPLDLEPIEELQLEPALDLEPIEDDPAERVRAKQAVLAPLDAWYKQTLDLVGDNPEKRAQALAIYTEKLKEQGVDVINEKSLNRVVGEIVGPPVAKGGKVTAAAIGDIANIVRGEAPENLAAFATQPEEALPVERKVKEAGSWQGFLGQVSLGASKAVPAAGVAVLGGAAGLSAPAANVLAMGFDEEGKPSPLGLAAALGLPIVDKAGRQLTAQFIEKRLTEGLKASKDIIDDPAALTEMIKLRYPTLQKEVVQKALEVAGGQLAGNAYLMALQSPGILESEDPKAAAMEAIAGNIGLALLGAGELVQSGRSLTFRSVAGKAARGEPIFQVEVVETPPSKQAKSSSEPGQPPTQGPPSPISPPAPPSERPDIIAGRPTTVLGANDAKLPAVYAWAPMEALQGSHAGDFVPNPAYAPLANTRRYDTDPAERDKVLKGAAEFEPSSYATNVRGAGEGPVMVSPGSDGTLRVMGGNGRLQMIQRLGPEQRAALDTVMEEEASVFGLPPLPGPEHLLVRMLPAHDVSTPAGVAAARQVVDVLNPSAGLMESMESMARNDAPKVARVTATMPRPDAKPGELRQWMGGLIGAGVLDRNTRPQILQSDAQLTDYAQRVATHAAYHSDRVVEYRQSPKTSVLGRGLVDAAGPFLLEARGRGLDVAPAFTELMHRVGDYEGEGQAIENVLQQVYGQEELFETNGGTIARGLAAVLGKEIVRDGKGKVDKATTLAAWGQMFASLRGSLAEVKDEPDLFGEKRTPEDVMRAWVGRRLGTADRQPDAPRTAGHGTRGGPSGRTTQGRKREARTAEERFTSPALGLTYWSTPTVKGTAPMALGGMQHVHPVDFPELVKLAKELMGGRVPFLKKFPKAAGMFYGEPGKARIGLRPELFKDSSQAAKVLAHEIGHLVDFLPNETLKRGNLLGRLFTLRSFLKNSFGPGSVTNKDLRAELIALSQYWKPYPPNPPASYVQYRESAVELYADALSVMLNSPGLLEQQAPKFYKEFWRAVNRKPEVQRVLTDLQDFLSLGKVPVLDQRGRDIEAMWNKGDELLKRKWAEREARRNSWKGYWLQLNQQLFDGHEPIIAKVRQAEASGAGWSPATDPRNILEEGLMIDNTNARFVQRVWDGVVKPIEDAGMTVEDLGTYLFLRRIEGERSEMANPLGITPEAARLQLLKMRLDLEMEKMTRLMAATQKFHALTFESVEEGARVGSYNKELFQTKLEPNKDVYAAFAVLDFLEDYVPAGIRKQIGTLREIANPFTATVMKTITLNNLNTIQRSKNATRDLLQAHFPAEIESADVAHGQVEPKPKADRGLLSVLEDGQRAFYYVDPMIAQAFERMSPQQLHRVTRVLGWTFKKIFYPVFITYNPAFQFAFNPKRDWSRTWRNLPNEVGAIKARVLLAKNYAGAWRSAVNRVAGRPDPLVTEALENFAIGTPWDTLTQGHRDDSFGKLLNKYHLLPEKERWKFLESMWLKPVRSVLGGIEFAGSVLESLPKLATYRLLRKDLGMSPAAAAAHVRNYAGTPNVFKRGKQALLVKDFVPFFNVFAQGWRSDLQRMTSPKTAGGWWFRWAMNDGLPKVLMAALGAGALGALGAALKQILDGASEYDKTNYLVVPVGWRAGGDFGKQAVYLRIPHDETSRLLSGMTYKLAKSIFERDPASATELFAFGAGQVPGVNPALTIPEKWVEYGSGWNPTDPFRGRPIIPQTEFAAGGMSSLKPMALWTWDQMGYSSYLHWNSKLPTTTEIALSAIPGLNRVVKVSDYGYREQQMQSERADDQARAQHRLAMPDNARSLLVEYIGLKGIAPERRTEVQEERYHTLNLWHNRVYRRFDEWITAAGQDSAPEEARKLRTELEKESKEFEKKR